MYVPTWFSVKKASSIAHGARHLFGMIDRSRDLADEVKKIMHPVIQRNSYFAHPEIILLSMVHDDRRHIRELGWRRMLKARDSAETGVRTFVLNKINMNAAQYYDMIEWQKETVSEPPITNPLKRDKILASINEGILPEALPDFPCHSQAVEQHVKLVTEASFQVCGAKARQGFMMSKLKSRAKLVKLPKLDTKSDLIK